MSADGDPAPRTLTAAQAAVQSVTDAFGWNVELKAGHAATFAKRLRTNLGLSLEQFVTEFDRHYGRRDPGAGEWWVYREQYPCKGQGAFPTPAIVRNTWGRWDLPTAIHVPGSAVGAMLNFIERLDAEERRSGDTY